MAELSGNPLPIVSNGAGDAPAPAQRGDFATEEQRKFRPDVYWYLSFRCNLACQHCSVFSSPDVDTSEDLTTEDCMDVVDQMAELNVRTALMSGGEVLFRPDALEILEGTVQGGVSVGLETNGMLITDEFLELAAWAQAQNKFHMCISLDGGTPETHDKVRGPNTFKRTLANLHRLAEANIRFDIQCILNRHNYPSIPQFMQHARDLRPALGAAQFGFLNPVGRGNEFVKEVGLRYEDLLRILGMIHVEQKNFDGVIMVKSPPAAVPPQYLGLIYKNDNMRGCTTCQFPLLGVLPNGDVTICALSRDNDEIFYGNTKSHRLKDIWIETRMDMLRSRYVAADDLAGICGDCVWQKSCKGSCRAWAYEEGGSFDSPFPLCAMLEETGQFPKVYRLSEQRKAMGASMPAEGSLLAKAGAVGGSCGCA